MNKGLAKTGEQLACGGLQASCPHSAADSPPLPHPNASARLAWAEQSCEKLRLQKTPARTAIVEVLARNSRPATLASLAADPTLKDRFDAATIYRNTMLLRDASVVREIAFSHKLRYFVLNSPDVANAYLICTCCGEVTPLASSALPPSSAAEAQSFGYSNIQPLVELRGLCPRCQKKPGITLPRTKL